MIWLQWYVRIISNLFLYVSIMELFNAKDDKIGASLVSIIILIPLVIFSFIA